MVCAEQELQAVEHIGMLRIYDADIYYPVFFRKRNGEQLFGLLHTNKTDQFLVIANLTFINRKAIKYTPDFRYFIKENIFLGKNDIHQGIITKKEVGFNLLGLELG